MEDNSFLIGDRVVTNHMVGEITKKSLTADGDYTYMVYNENDESCEWCSDEDMTLEWEETEAYKLWNF